MTYCSGTVPQCCTHCSMISALEQVASPMSLFELAADHVT